MGTAFAARTQHASLREIGLTTNPLLLVGITFELLFAAAVIYLPPLQAVFGTAPIPGWALVLLLPMPIIVWAVDEMYRGWQRAHADRSEAQPVRTGTEHPERPDVRLKHRDLRPSWLTTKAGDGDRTERIE